MRQRLTAGRIWKAPAAIAFSTAIGLLSALLGDGFWDIFSWVTLGMPIVVIFRYSFLSANKSH